MERLQRGGKKHPSQTTARYLLSAAPAAPRTGAYVDLCAACWDVVVLLLLLPVVVVGPSLAGCVFSGQGSRSEELQKLHTRPKSQTCKGGNWLDSTCNGDGKTLSPAGPRQRGSGAEWRGFLASSDKPAWNELRGASHVTHVRNLIFAKHLEFGYAR